MARVEHCGILMSIAKFEPHLESDHANKACSALHLSQPANTLLSCVCNQVSTADDLRHTVLGTLGHLSKQS